MAAVACAWLLFPATVAARGGWGPYGWFPPFAHGRPYSSLRLQIAPRDTEVFVDGYYAGLVDDFDGTFQRLTLDAGPHRIEIRKPGFNTVTFDVQIPDDETVTWKGRLTEN